MKKRIKKVTLSAKKSARRALAANLAKALIASARIKTTKTKAKFAQKCIEKLVSLAKKDTLAANRRIFAAIGDKATVKKLIGEIGPKFSGKTSGFTRVINLGQRLGDAAPMAFLEFAYPPEAQKGARETKEIKETPLRSEKQSFEGQAKETKGAKNAKKKS